MPKCEAVVLDTCALLAFLFGEPEYSDVRELFDWALDHNQRHLMSCVNWAEVRYIVERRSGAKKWPEVMDAVAGLPLEIIPSDQDLAESAGKLKIRGGMSLADCFAAALAQKYNIPVCTRDPEFQIVAHEIEIHWL